MKDSRRLERIFKGPANHWRIEIILLIDKNPGITMFDIAARLNANKKTISEHIRKLVIAGLVRKKYQGREVSHELSPYGEKVCEILRKF